MPLSTPISQASPRLSVAFVLFAALSFGACQDTLSELHVIENDEVTQILSIDDEGDFQLADAVHPEASFALVFADPVSSESVEKAVSLEDSRGQRLDVLIEQRLTTFIITPRTPLERGQTHLLKVDSGITKVSDDEHESWQSYTVLFHVDCLDESCDPAPPSLDTPVRDPDGPDLDADGLDDAYEVAIGTDPTSDDSDADGVPDGAEVDGRCDPMAADSDDDGLADADELAGGTDCIDPDSDADGMLDGAEIERGTDPLNADTDADGEPDGAEVDCVSSPLDPYMTCASVGDTHACAPTAP